MLIYQPEIEEHAELTGEVFGELHALWEGEHVVTCGDTPTNMLSHVGYVVTFSRPDGCDTVVLTRAGEYVVETIFGEYPWLPENMARVEPLPVRP